ncbi:HEAT repeat domain-containing protein, partial [Bacteroides eggerthii]
ADTDTQKELSPLLLKKYRESGFNTVRMEAIKLLSRYQDDNFIEALREGLNDAYEMVARQSAIYAGFVGDDSLLPAIVEALVEHNERLRVQMSANKALSLYPKEKVEKVIEDFYAKVDRLNENEEKKRLLRSLERMCVQEAKVHQTLMDVAAPEAKRISAIRNVRNYTFHFHVDDYLNVIRDAGNPQEVRVVMAEALGWFTNSVQRPHILEEIKKMQQTANLPEDLKAELEQTIKRLSL